MPVKVAVNGFGRIGRLTFRYLWEDPKFDIVHVNDLCSCESAAYLVKYDSVHGTWNKTVECEGDDAFTVDGKRLTFSRHKDFTQVPFQDMGVEMVLECTGKFLKVATLQPYFDVCGVKNVVVSAPVKEAGAVNIVLGCNHQLLNETNCHLVTNASCTTNCLGPVVRAIHSTLEIEHGCITTIHDVTGTQTIVDMPNTKKSDLRRARSGMVNLCPTSTGSATAIVEIYPELKGKLNGLAVRVPLLNASLTDCVFEVKNKTTAEAVNAILKEFSENQLKGVMGFETMPLVSTDYTDDTRSCIIDALSTQVIDDTMVKIYAWYDNECGYSKRMAELCNLVASKFILKEEPTFDYPNPE
eukprot:CAMPEP_0196802394 /NCGR_PEP_ID=MMETSP1362-20130617/2009_1 /TAXON_ID=163516 /ORGANISM="Leptocylindrus danicus, Strain CCMP1856" /LENGTH=354 /DNA_ID=CAMNT_0042173675 /DNA_START=99 /DNA_END=1163 /DNA_ORIENTATION=-